MNNSLISNINMQYLAEEKGSLTLLALLIILSIFIAAIIIVGIIKIISVAVKLHKAKKKASSKVTDETYTILFGGIDNIVKTERSLNRIMIEVSDRAKVDVEKLKEMNIGTQITGNIIKCSSSEMADALEKIKK